MTIAEKRAVFRALHESGFFIIPNAWDGGSAARLTKLGFKAIASTSAGAAWAAGKDDGGLSLEEVLAHLDMLVKATDLPVNADFENGFADDPEGVAANVARAVGVGVAGISIEDWSGSGMYESGLAVERISAARACHRGYRSCRDADRAEREFPCSWHGGFGEYCARGGLCGGGDGLPVRALYPRSWGGSGTGGGRGTEAGECGGFRLRCGDTGVRRARCAAVVAWAAAWPGARGKGSIRLHWR